MENAGAGLIHQRWEALETAFRDRVEATLAQSPTHSRQHAQVLREFALGRFQEGRAIAKYLLDRSGGRKLLVVDVGSGNGGIGLAVANAVGLRVVALDFDFNSDLLDMRRKISSSLKHLIADARLLPFREMSIDAVLCLEVLEHVDHPQKVGREIFSTLRTDGLCMVTTPSRLRHLLGPDPHYGIRGLLLLPDRLQRFTAVSRGADYDVSHIFWHVKEIMRLFPDPKSVEVIWDKMPPFPDRVRTRIWWAFRYFLWNRIIIRREIA